MKMVKKQLKMFKWLNLFKKTRLALFLPLLIFPKVILALTLESPIKHNSFEQLIEAIIDFLLSASLILAPLFIIIGGFYFITSVGDIRKVETAKKIILYTLIGFLIILLAKGLVNLFINTVIGVPPGEPPPGNVVPEPELIDL